MVKIGFYERVNRAASNSHSRISKKLSKHNFNVANRILEKVRLPEDALRELYTIALFHSHRTPIPNTITKMEEFKGIDIETLRKKYIYLMEADSLGYLNRKIRHISEDNIKTINEYIMHILENNLELVYLRIIDLTSEPITAERIQQLRDVVVEEYKAKKLKDKDIDKLLEEHVRLITQIYMPFADGIGMDDEYTSLRDSAAKILYPRVFDGICDYLRHTINYATASAIEDFTSTIGEILREWGADELNQSLFKSYLDIDERYIDLITKSLDAKPYMYGRIKSPGSLTFKLINKGIIEDIEGDIQSQIGNIWEKVDDVIAFTAIIDFEGKDLSEVVVPDIAEELEKKNRRIKVKSIEDYIKHPKATGYKAVHLNISVGGLSFEVQIKNREMWARSKYGEYNHGIMRAKQSGFDLDSKSLTAITLSLKYSNRIEYLEHAANVFARKQNKYVTVKIINEETGRTSRYKMYLPEDSKLIDLLAVLRIHSPEIPSLNKEITFRGKDGKIVNGLFKPVESSMEIEISRRFANSRERLKKAYTSAGTLEGLLLGLNGEDPTIIEDLREARLIEITKIS